MAIIAYGKRVSRNKDADSVRAGLRPALTLRHFLSISCAFASRLALVRGSRRPVVVSERRIYHQERMPGMNCISDTSLISVGV